MIIDKLIRLWILLQQMRSAQVGSAIRASYVDRILPKYLATECPTYAQDYLRREISREKARKT